MLKFKLKQKHNKNKQDQDHKFLNIYHENFQKILLIAKYFSVPIDPDFLTNCKNVKRTGNFFLYLSSKLSLLSKFKLL